MSYRELTRRALESSDARARQDKYLLRIQSRHAALCSFADVDALVRELHDVRGNRDVKDAILLALIVEHQRSHVGDAFAVLTRALLPAIEHLFHVVRRRGRRIEVVDDGDLWGRLVGAFIDTLDRYPVERRPMRVAANVQMDTMAALFRLAEGDKRLTEERRRATVVMKEREKAGDPISFGDLVVPGNGPPIEPDAAEFTAAERVLDAYVAAGVIDQIDRFLLLGTNLYGRRLGQLGAELGLSREAAKKRHLRALRRVRMASQQHKREL